FRRGRVPRVPPYAGFRSARARSASSSPRSPRRGASGTRPARACGYASSRGVAARGSGAAPRALPRARNRAPATPRVPARAAPPRPTAAAARCGSTNAAARAGPAPGPPPPPLQQAPGRRGGTGRRLGEPVALHALQLALEKPPVELRVVRDEQVVPGKGQEAAHDGPHRRRPPQLRVAQPRQPRDRV